MVNGVCLPCRGECNKTKRKKGRNDVDVANHNQELKQDQDEVSKSKS